MDLSIVIPCFNEFDNVPKLQQEFLPVARKLAQTHSAVEIVFVDDGSSDGTMEALKATFHNDPATNITFKFVPHEVNKGLGAAMRTGFAAATGEIVVSTDSDGTYKFETIPTLLAYLKPGVDIVTASAYHPEGGVADVPAYRIMLSRSSSAIYRILVDWRVHTYTCLFRAYRRRVLEHVSFESNGYLAGTELLVGAMLVGYKVAEYPAVLHARIFGVSKAKLMRTIMDHLKFQGRVLLHRLHLGSVVRRSRTVGG